MLKRCLSPLTLVNQVALIVLLSTAIGLAGMAVSGWLVQGVQGSAHAINKADRCACKVTVCWRQCH
ncbi:nitrate/nitrite two-component sensor kinase [Escherichia coli]|uniref:Nitrate/nitrite two-component sensor kinase n=1 Tax=Escherichia coli TaxID=562 RepID=A0A2X1MVK5_ECOLX|nr:nitrate/nitrite two-component sensor kinase [Escherichia coli]